MSACVVAGEWACMPECIGGFLIKEGPEVS